MGTRVQKEKRDKDTEIQGSRRHERAIVREVLAYRLKQERDTEDIETRKHRKHQNASIQKEGRERMDV